MTGKRLTTLRERKVQKKREVERSLDVRPRVRARVGAGGSLPCRFSLDFTLCASICGPIRYTFGSGLGFCYGIRFASGELRTVAALLVWIRGEEAGRRLVVTVII